MQSFCRKHSSLVVVRGNDRHIFVNVLVNGHNRQLAVLISPQMLVVRPDNQPVDLLFALLVPADQTKTHLHTLSLVAKRLADKTICRRLRAAQSDQELYQIITDTEGVQDEA